MTDHFTIASADAWARKFGELRTVNNVFEKATDRRDKSRALDKLVQTQEELLRLGAPDISAVIEKLLILWEEQIDGDTQEAGFMMLLIGDLRRLEALGQ